MPPVSERLADASEAAVKPDDLFSNRAPLRKKFLEDSGWAEAELTPVGQDCAFRRYFRLYKSADHSTAILMEALSEDHPVATPGHKISDFVRLGRWLKTQGINTPDIYHADIPAGYALLEDFGDISFKKALTQSVDSKKLYCRAADVLRHMAALKDLPELPLYRGSHVDQGRVRVVDWYLPVVKGVSSPRGLRESYQAVWDQIEAKLPPCPTGFLHVDFHVENLMWLPGQSGLAQCGVLDFQGAMKGPVVYDLANLLEDPRQDIPADLRTIIFSHYSASLPPEEREVIASWYRVLATQFHCRVIGQFIKLALRAGKPRYLGFIPRLESYLREGLKDPLLAPLQDWFAAQGLSFDSELTALPDVAESVIDPEAS